MLIDMHAHSSGISSCCRINYEQVITSAKAGGLDGVVLTNHYPNSFIKNDTLASFVEKYISEYETARFYGKKNGCQVFFGIEVTMKLYPKVHMLVYGLEPVFLRQNPLLFELSQKELFTLVKKNEGVLIQAHPFRNGTTVLDPDFLDGIEINCHPLYKKSYSEKILNIAEKNRFIVTCGGDFHADTYRPVCGMDLPENITDNKGILSYLLSHCEKHLVVHEPNTDMPDKISVKSF